MLSLPAFIPAWRRLWCSALWVGAWWVLTLPVQASLTVRDDGGREITLSQPAQRIVSLLPSLTETVCVLGGCSRLVGVDRYSNWPASVQSLPRMGGGIDPNIEAIVAARPDVVLLAGSTRGADRLEALGIKVIRFEPRSVADARRVLLALSQLLGLPANEGLRVWRDIESTWIASAASVPKMMQGLRVYFEVSSIPYGAGPHSFIGETLTQLGLVNIISADMGPYPKINPEFVVRAQPDIIMLSDSPRSSLTQRPGWSAMQAVQNNRICVFNQADSEMLARAGPRLAEAAKRVAECLQRLARESR